MYEKTWLFIPPTTGWKRLEGHGSKILNKLPIQMANYIILKLLLQSIFYIRHHQIQSNPHCLKTIFCKTWKLTISIFYQITQQDDTGPTTQSKRLRQVQGDRKDGRYEQRKSKTFLTATKTKSVFKLLWLQGPAYFAVRKPFIVNYPLHEWHWAETGKQQP